jgi:hypothetical protein
MRGNAVNRGEMKDVLHLPCAGITLIRFDGFNLRFPLLAGNTPGKL